jgi:hypothetical protein
MLWLFWSWCQALLEICFRGFGVREVDQLHIGSVAVADVY